MSTSDLTPLYGWNEKAGRYYNLTGKPTFVSFADVRNALESNISVSQANMRALTEQLIAVPPTISLDQWQVDMMREIKQANISASAAARGGWAQMTQSDWGAVGQQVRTQYDYLRNFANEIASGKQRLNGSALVRADLYGQAARGNFEEMRRRMAKLEGMTDEMRVLGEADHCDDCLSAAGHWAPIGTLPRIGDSQCVTNCRCTFKYRRPNGNSGWVYDNGTGSAGNIQVKAQVKEVVYRDFSKLTVKEIRKYGEEISIDWRMSLKQEQRKAVKEYTNNGFNMINRSLRGNLYEDDFPADIEKAKQFIPNIDSALETSKLPDDIVVYRGVNKDVFDGYDPNDLIDSVYIDKGFVSTSLYNKTTFSKKDYQFEINIPAGSKGAYLGSLSVYDHQNELEVLFPRGSRFQVDAIIGNIVKMTLLP